MSHADAVVRCLRCARTLTAVATAALLAPAAHGARTYTFQQGLSGYTGTVDTFIRQSAPNTSHGALETLEWHSDDPAGSGLDSFALLRFDNMFGLGPDQIPPGAPIISATLFYSLTGGNSVGTMNEALASWDGASTFNNFGPAAGVQGADFSIESISSPYGTFGVVNVTRSITKWSENPSLNKGWIIRPTNSVTWGRFRSSEASSMALRPTLQIVVNDTSTPTLLRKPYLQKATPTSITICWRTDMATASRVRYGAAPGALTEEAVNAALTKNHFVTIEGLSPGAKYFYEVGSTTHALAGNDANHYFTTYPPAGASVPVSIWIAGDSGSANAPQSAARNAMIAANGGVSPDLGLNVGDIAYINATDGEFNDNFLNPYHTVMRNAVVWPAIGNHEHFNASSITQTGPYYELFVLPKMGESGGAPSGTEAYYSFDYGDVHFISLNADGVPRTPGSPMLTWLASDLAAAQASGAKWLIAFWHHPAYSRGTHNSDLEVWSIDMRQNVLPMLEQAGVDLVINGHSHGYERSFLLDGAYATPTVATGHVVNGGDGDPSGDGAYTKTAGLNPREGAVYVVAGHGASAHGLGVHPVIFFNEAVVGSCLVTIADGALTFRNIRHDGVVSDTFMILKGVGAPPCPADLNGDGDVGAPDLAQLLGNWGLPGPADLNLDGSVSAGDLAILLGGWGPCPE